MRVVITLRFDSHPPRMRRGVRSGRSLMPRGAVGMRPDSPSVDAAFHVIKEEDGRASTRDRKLLLGRQSGRSCPDSGGAPLLPFIVAAKLLLCLQRAPGYRGLLRGYSCSKQYCAKDKRSGKQY